MLVVSCLAIQLGACAGSASRSNTENADAADPDDSSPELAIQWVLDSSEYIALSRQVYRTAALALPGMLEDKSWSALPDQVNAENLPPAIIMDVDETAVSNARFQVSLEQPFSDGKLNAWSEANDAQPVPGAVEFARLANDFGVSIFFVTNRPCETDDITGESCPQKNVVINDLLEAGFHADETNVLLARARADWRSEKSVRRNHIAETHRVVMLIGDDLGDFIACTRKRPLAPCTKGATRSSRRSLVEQYDAYWGAGWYVLPNPMHGSWTSIED